MLKVIRLYLDCLGLEFFFAESFGNFGDQNTKSTAINLPPPSIPKQPLPRPQANMWAPDHTPIPNPIPSKDIAVLGADIIAETLGKKSDHPQQPQMPHPHPPPKLLPPDIVRDPREQQHFPGGLPLGPPEGGGGPPPLPQHHQGPLPLPPQMQQHHPPGPPDKGEWNPRLGPPPPQGPRCMSGGPLRGEEFGNWLEGGPPDFHHNQSPFSWQRSNYARERRPSYEEDRPFHSPHDFPQNPYVYRRPDNEPHPPPPPPASQQRDPRLPVGDPRSMGDPRRGARQGGAPPPQLPEHTQERERYQGGPPPMGGPHDHHHPPGPPRMGPHDHAPPGERMGPHDHLPRGDRGPPPMGPHDRPPPGGGPQGRGMPPPNMMDQRPR